MSDSSDYNHLQLLQALEKADFQALARCITLVENELPGYEQLLLGLPSTTCTRTVGITGPPGAGKSTLVDALVSELKKKHKKIAVLAVDPSSPFSSGSLLGDRIRMGRHFNDPQVFIRSMATRGASGGLNPKIIEVTDLVKAANFDYLFIETVGVGQGELDVAGLADVTVVVLVPGSGDGIQAMKSGLMEVADIFAVNKSDLPGAGSLVKDLMDHPRRESEVPVVRTVASENQGTGELLEKINILAESGRKDQERQAWFLAEKTMHLIRERRMRGIEPGSLQKQITERLKQGDFNLYRFVDGLA